VCVCVCVCMCVVYYNYYSRREKSKWENEDDGEILGPLVVTSRCNFSRVHYVNGLAILAVNSSKKSDNKSALLDDVCVACVIRFRFIF